IDVMAKRKLGIVRPQPAASLRAKRSNLRHLRKRRRLLRRAPRNDAGIGICSAVELERMHRMAWQDPALAQRYAWPGDDLTLIPDWVYTDETIYAREVERIFHGATWNYVALEAEVPNAGDYIRSNVGPTPVVVARAEDGAITVVENRCMHRAAEFCRELSGTAKEFICPYHQWTYDLKGNLIGVPFRRGVAGKGGMPADFKPAEHGLRKLNVTTHRGVVFASYAHDMEAFTDYLGPEVLREFEATFD